MLGTSACRHNTLKLINKQTENKDMISKWMPHHCGWKSKPCLLATQQSRDSSHFQCVHYECHPCQEKQACTESVYKEGYLKVEHLRCPCGSPGTVASGKSSKSTVAYIALLRSENTKLLGNWLRGAIIWLAFTPHCENTNGAVIMKSLELFTVPDKGDGRRKYLARVTLTPLTAWAMVRAANSEMGTKQFCQILIWNQLLVCPWWKKVAH